MRRLLLSLGLVVAAGLVGWLGWRYGATSPPIPGPGDGRVKDGVYTNPYFGLRYPLPPGWVEDVAGPEPSAGGYYALKAFVPQGELKGAILIAAEDLFFAAGPAGGAAAMAEDFRQSIAKVQGMAIDRGPAAVKISDRLLHRVDFSGVGLHRAMFATEIRCHLVSFNLTSNDPRLLAELADSLNAMAPASAGTRQAPVCLKDYAVEGNLLRRVEPAAVGPRFAPIPVRIIIGTDGAVRHVHVVRATPEQRRSIEEALRQWQFKPHSQDGRPVEVETGLTFKFG